MNRPTLLAVLAFSVLASRGPAAADVRLPSVMDSHMVLQRDMPLKVWGFADKGEPVMVELAGARATTTADDKGEWIVTLPAMKAGGPHKLTIAGNNKITLDDILVGEVWIGSGQSNMQWGVNASNNAGAEIAAANYPNIRLFLVPNVLSGIPNSDVKADWKACAPSTIPSFSAVLYYFGRHLHKELDIPIGLIASAWGGSLIEPWTPPPGFAGVKKVTGISDNVRTTQVAYLDALGKTLVSPTPQTKAWLEKALSAAKNDELLPPAPAIALPGHALAGWASPTSMYNAMINPLVPFAFRGAIWYQGESNLNDGMLYAHKKRALVEGWRKVWGHDLSFYWTHLAPYNYGGDPGRLPRIWEAQQAATSIPGTGTTVITDIGNLRDIHPRNKQEVGRRLALVALAKDYGRDIVHSGPVYKGMKIEGSKVRVSFSHTGSGLQSRDGKPLSRFEIAGDAGFVPATAVIDGGTVVVASDRVASPSAVRFGWHQLAEPNLQNKEGLQACPFRTNSTAPSVSGKKMFVSSSPVQLDCIEEGGVIRYTVDGSTPTEKSTAYKEGFEIRDTTTVKARFFRADGAASIVTAATFTKVEPRIVDGKKLIPGLAYEYYEGNWGALPDFDTLKPAAKGICEEFSLAVRKRNDGFALRFTGYVEIKSRGRYTFQTESDDGSRLYVDGKEILNNDGVHPSTKKAGSLTLDPGMHKVVVTYFEGSGQEYLKVLYGSGGRGKQLSTWCED
ncbi:MAG: PA14 domain-containing protein [Planctomycetota bacterium]|nr:PA14 domain-containing protein [Planctomycetota bacterium]